MFGEGGRPRRCPCDVPPRPHGRWVSNTNISDQRLVCPGGQRARPGTARLEGHPQAKLDQARKIVLASYLTKVGTSATTGIRRTELGVIESIEEFPPEFDPIPVVNAKLGVLEEGEVKVPRSVIPYVRLRSRIVAVVVHPGRPVGEYGSIKPMG